MKKRLVFALGAAYGLLMRLVFGAVPFAKVDMPAGSTGVMLASFVLLVPAMIGLYTVYALRQTRPSLLAAMVLPIVPVLCFVAGTALLLIEGSICIAMALPLFVAMAVVGGMVGWLVLRWFVPSAGSMHALMLLPLALAWAEHQAPLPDALRHTEASVWIAAPPEQVWQHIHNARDISPDELPSAWVYKVGVPYPDSGVTQWENGQRVRKSRWGKGVQFDEPITLWEENRRVRWRYVFGPNAFPPGAMDEHVVLGGRYLDLLDTGYLLTPQDGGTRLTVQVNYRVSTPFNAYAAPLSQWLVDDTARAILGFYKQRSERAPVRASGV